MLGRIEFSLQETFKNFKIFECGQSYGRGRWPAFWQNSVFEKNYQRFLKKNVVVADTNDGMSMLCALPKKKLLYEKSLLNLQTLFRIRNNSLFEKKMNKIYKA